MLYLLRDGERVCTRRYPVVHAQFTVPFVFPTCGAESSTRTGAQHLFTSSPDDYAVCSSQTIVLDRAVDPESAANKGNVERWLLELEAMQWQSVRTQVTLALEEYSAIPREQWVLNWSAQAVLGVSQVSTAEGGNCGTERLPCEIDRVTFLRNHFVHNKHTSAKHTHTRSTCFYGSLPATR